MANDELELFAQPAPAPAPTTALKVARVALDVPLRRLFDYSVPDALEPVYGPGGAAEPLVTKVGRFGAMICYEVLFPDLVRDLVRISRADRHAADAERERIVQVAELVFPESADNVVRATERVVIAEEEFASGKITISQLENTTKDVAAKAAAFGAPIAAVSLAGSVSGLSGAGITSGLAALGFGGLLGLSAMVTGIGTVVIGESHTFQGGADWLRENGVTVVDLDSEECRDLLQGFIAAHPEVWNEDIGE